MALSKNQKLGLFIGGAVGVVALGVAYMAHASSKKEEEAKAPDVTPPPVVPPPDVEPTGPEPTEAIYSMTPAASLRFDALPMAKKEHMLMLISPVPGDAQSAVLAGIRAAALNSFGSSVEHGVINGPIAFQTFEDMSTNFANGHGTSSDLLVVFVTAGAVPDDPSIMQGATAAPDPAARVALLKEYIGQLRHAAPDQRILWVLDATAEPELAKALNEAHEEWIRVPPNRSLGAAAGAVAQAVAQVDVQNILSAPADLHP